MDAQDARALQEHVRTCEGCRRYLEEIANVTKTLAAMPLAPELEASASFDRRVADALRAEGRTGISALRAAFLRGTRLNWRVALPLAGALVVALVVVSARVRSSVSPAHRPSLGQAQVVPAPRLESDLPPTIANYRMLANRSLEQLDEVLTRQANQCRSVVPIYTASVLALAAASD